MKFSFLLSALFSFFLLHATGQQKEALVFEGTIDKYPIVMTFTEGEWETGEVLGYYLYKGKKTSLTLTGHLFPPCLYLEEYYKGDTTGFFYLENEETLKNWKGYWSNDKKSLAVSLSYVSGDVSILSCKSSEDYSKSTNADKQGTYELTNYFINDYWLDQNGQVEIGTNNTELIIEELDPNSVQFYVEAICGPTYHYAFASGIAHKENDVYVYRNEDECEIVISFKGKHVTIKANDSMSCGFGARAYLDHELVKIKDEVVRAEDNR